FANMRRVGKGFSGVETPLFENMLAVRAVNAEEEVQVPAQDDVVQEHVIEEIATENANAAQQLEIIKLKAKDVETVFNQGRISVDMETDEGIELEVDQEKCAEEDTEVQKAVKVVTTAKLITEVVTGAATQVAAATETPTMKDKGKGILIEDPKPMKKKDQIEMDAEYAKKLQEELEKEHEEAYEEIIKSINETPAHKAAKRRKLSEEVQEADDLRGRLEIVQDEDDDVFVEAIPLAQKVPVVDYQVVVIDNKPRHKIIRADDTHQFYISFTTLLKNFDREDLKTL
nr:hypothetical protein [Tanacetum cinerariifolium]